nr:hypothetical protein GCM10025699_18620 [Microbacterium flavescens]
MRQTLDMSTLQGVAAGRPVNLERATVAHGRLGGHIVQGHIDGTGEVLEVRPGAQWRVLRIALPADLAPLVVDKGSIAVDGVSLTVSAVSPAVPADGVHWFEVSLIPETLEATTLGAGSPATASTSRPTSSRATCSAFTPSLQRLRPHPQSPTTPRPPPHPRKEARNEPFHHSRGAGRDPRRQAGHRRRR